jgi:hypothetical protein
MNIAKRACMIRTTAGCTRYTKPLCQDPADRAPGRLGEATLPSDSMQSIDVRMRHIHAHPQAAWCGSIHGACPSPSPRGRCGIEFNDHVLVCGRVNAWPRPQGNHAIHGPCVRRLPHHIKHRPGCLVRGTLAGEVEMTRPSS